MTVSKQLHSFRIKELDGFRGIAAFMVMLYHYTTRYDHLYGHAGKLTFEFPWGHYGVNLFFIISGYVIFMTLEKIKLPTDFVFSRFSRLYPTYWICIIFTYLVLMACPLPDRSVQITDFVVNFTMIQHWLGVPSVDGVYWTLFVELSFYFWMFILISSNKLSHIEKFGFIVLLIGLAYQITEMVTGKKLPMPIRTFFLLDYCNLFFAGILFYKIRCYGFDKWRVILLGLCFVSQVIMGDRESVLFSLVFALLFTLFIFGKASFFSNRLFTFLGAISYALYLIHQNFGYVIIRFLNYHHAHPVATLVLPICLSILVAAAITYLFEKPTLKYLREKYILIQQAS